MKMFKRSGCTDEYDQYMNIDFINHIMGENYHRCLDTKKR